jgi:hypothetical protein
MKWKKLKEMIEGEHDDGVIDDESDIIGIDIYDESPVGVLFTKTEDGWLIRDNW